MSTVKSGVRISTADGRWFIHRLHGVCYVSWVEARDKAEAERFPPERSQQWLENMQQMTGMDDLKIATDDATLKTNDPVDKPLPEPAYPCALCWEEFSTPAAKLFWSERLQGWCCDDCWDDVLKHQMPGNQIEKRGVSLADELKRRGLSR
jgi:hypothetical protein